MKIAYLDCFSGISGDMFLGALLDAGLSLEELRAALSRLGVGEIRLEVSRERRQSISGTRFRVQEPPGHPPARNLESIGRMIRKSGLSQAVKQKSLAIFEDLASVEGGIHQERPEHVHFHEVGAADSIIDIVGVVYALERLQVAQLTVSALPLGSGFIDAAHGRLPLPAPATAALLRGIPVYDAGLPFEMVTPTGAALAKHLADAFGPMPPMKLLEVGYGAGKRDLPDRPNLLRILIGETPAENRTDTVVVLEANIDDMSPECLGYLMERLFEAGALDVSFTPLLMKKSRPGTGIQVIASPQRRQQLLELMFSESTTLGVRFHHCQRKTLERDSVEIDSPWGPLKVKRAVKPDGTRLILPEYEACRALARTCGRPLQEIFHWVMSRNRVAD